MIGESDYAGQLSSTYDFVRNTCCELVETDPQVSNRIRKCFKARSIAILEVKERNIEIVRPLGVVGLLRMFESFLEQDAGTLKRGVIPKSNRYSTRPFLWRMASGIRHKRNNQAAEPETLTQESLGFTEHGLLLQIEQHRESSLSRFLERNGAAGLRFQNLRRGRLVLPDEIANPDRINGTAGNVLLPQIAPVGSLSRELPG